MDSRWLKELDSFRDGYISRRKGLREQLSPLLNAMQMFEAASDSHTLMYALCQVVSAMRRADTAFWKLGNSLPLTRRKNPSLRHLFGKQRLGLDEWHSEGRLPDHPPYDDHPYSMGSGRVTYYYVSEPYGLDGHRMQEIADFAQRWDLEVSLDAGSASHCAAHTVAVVYCRKELAKASYDGASGLVAFPYSKDPDRHE